MGQWHNGLCKCYAPYRVPFSFSYYDCVRLWGKTVQLSVGCKSQTLFAHQCPEGGKRLCLSDLPGFVFSLFSYFIIILCWVCFGISDGWGGLKLPLHQGDHGFREPDGWLYTSWWLIPTDGYIFNFLSLKFCFWGRCRTWTRAARLFCRSTQNEKDIRMGP